jgi:hypothetical protein
VPGLVVPRAKFSRADRRENPLSVGSTMRADPVGTDPNGPRSGPYSAEPRS